MTALDRLLARRACLLSLGFALILALIVVSTDEQATSIGLRLGRFVSMLGVAGSAGAFLAAEQARSRGEFRALAAIGVTPIRASLGPVLGGMVVGLVGAALVLCPAVDIAPLFPRMDGAGLAFRTVGPDTVLEPALRLLVHSSGTLERAVDLPPRGTSEVASTLPRVATSAALLVLAVCAPCWASLRCGLTRRALVGLATVAVCIAAFHLVGAARFPAWTLVLSPSLLVADCAMLGYRERG